MIEEQKGKWDGKMSADSMLKEEREREKERKGKFLHGFAALYKVA